MKFSLAMLTGTAFASGVLLGLGDIPWAVLGLGVTGCWAYLAALEAKQ